MIRHLVATPTSAIIANREVHSVRVSADLELFNREGDAIVLEVRFSDSHGSSYREWARGLSWAIRSLSLFAKDLSGECL